MKFTIRQFFVGMTLLGVALGGVLWWDRETSRDVHLFTYDCGRGREMVFSAVGEWEVSRSLMYKILVDGREWLPNGAYEYLSYGDLDGQCLRVQQSSDGELVAFFACSNPSEPLIVHDFATGISWPNDRWWRADPDLTYADNRKKREALISTLMSNAKTKTNYVTTLVYVENAANGGVNNRGR